MSDQDLDRVRRTRQLSALKIQSVLRAGLVALMFVAVEVGVTPHWREQLALTIGYGVLAVCAAIVAFFVLGPPGTPQRLQAVYSIVDIGAVFGYKLLSPPGAYLPLMILALLPMMVVLDVSLKRAAAVLAVAAVAFSISVYTDNVLLHKVGWTRPTLVVLMFLCLCCTAICVVYLQVRHVNEIATLSTSRERLLAQTMTASDEQQRKMSEFLHDGPLQYLLAARQDIAEHLGKHPDERLSDALASLKTASDQLREATFELHPAVLEHSGLAAAITQLTSVMAERKGIEVTADIDYPASNGRDPLLFGVARELLSNVVRHSQATEVTVTLNVADHTCRLAVIDNGVGLSPERAAERLAQGHIGLASHRTRVEATGGTMETIATQRGTHIEVVVPLKDE